MASLSFNTKVSSRTRVASEILGSPELLAYYEAAGGRRADLEKLFEAGKRAEALNIAQSQAGASATAASGEVAVKFVELQREYGSIMASVKAVDYDLSQTELGQSVCPMLRKILSNETELRLDVKEKDGVKKRSGHRSQTQEAIRNEIEKDASGLLALTEAHTALAERKVDVPRLEALRNAAQGFAGKLSERTQKKGALAGATAEERKAVQEQGELWAACSRLLKAVGERDARVESLLREATRK